MKKNVSWIFCLLTLPTSTAFGQDSCPTPEGYLRGPDWVLDPGCLQDDTSFATVGGGCMDLATGLVWSTGPDLGWVYYTKAEIIEHCSSLDEGGYSDWRAATRDELLTVANHGAKNHVKLACTLSDNLYWATSAFTSASSVSFRGTTYDQSFVSFNPAQTYPMFDPKTHLIYSYGSGSGICVRGN